MKPNIIYTVVVSALVCYLPFASSACTKCPITEEDICYKCDCGLNPSQQFVINCKNKDLTQVPTFTSSPQRTYHEITLADNQITSIPANKFSALPIAKLVITGNPITSIHNTAFQGLGASLKELLLEVNSMSSFPQVPLSVLGGLETLSMTGFELSTGLPAGALQNLNQLSNLILSQNNLQTLPIGALSGQTTSLRELTLNGNSMSTVPTSALSELQNLDKLSIVGDSALSSLPANAFQGSRFLHLDLSQNGFKSNIDSNAFNGLQSTLQTLTLSSCQLTDSVLQSVNGLSNLRELDMSLNQGIANIPDNFFSSMDLLTKLNFHRNSIQQLKKATLLSLVNLLVLDVSSNSLSNVASDTFSSTPKLQELYLEENNNLATLLQLNTFNPIRSQLRILNMEQTGFTNEKWPLVSDLPLLQTLSLTNNQITQLPNMAFENLKQLETINLDDNSLTSISQRNLHGPNNELRAINLNNNNLQTIAECVFHEFTAFNYYQLGLTNNPLDCDCHLLWLLQKLQQQPNYETEKYTINWKCASPPQHADKFFARQLSESDLVCSLPETAAPCEDLTPTTTTISTTSTGTTAGGGPGPTDPMVTFLLNISVVTDTEMELHWFLSDTQGLQGFRVEYWVIPEGEKLSEVYGPTVRQAKLEELEPASDYIVCVMAQGVDWLGSTQCLSATTMPPAGSVEPGKNNTLLIALGCTLGALVIIAIIVIVCVCKRRQRRKKSEAPYQNGLSTSSASGSTNSAFGVRVGGDSKRFTRLNREKINHQNQENMAFEHKLEGFSREEQDRILGLVSHHGASTLSMLSTASNPRYVREQTPLPAVPGDTAMGGYLNPAGVRDDVDKHLYSEIPGESNYQEIPVDSFI